METVYLLIEREFIKTKEPIFKIGCSKQENDKRIKQYPKGTQLLLQVIVLDCVYIEKKIKYIFKEKYKQRTDIGIEYFEGDAISMRNDFLNIINIYDKLSNNHIIETSLNKIIDNKNEVNDSIKEINIKKFKKEKLEELKQLEEEFKKLNYEQIEHLKSVELQFMEYLAFEKFEKDTIVRCKPPEIMEWFNVFLMNNNINNCSINSMKLGVRIALLKLKGIQKIHDNRGTIYLINVAKLKNNFKNTVDGEPPSHSSPS
jgi:hypothetical protein